MGDGLFARVIDRAAANARAIGRAPEAVAIGIISLGVAYFDIQHSHRERVAVLNDTIASQERLLADYRTKLRGAAPEEIAAEIDKLTTLLAQTQKSLSEATKPASAVNAARDPRRLYADNNPIALTQDPQIDLHKKEVTFRVVSAAAILEIDKLYEFQDWKLACGGGTQLYTMINDGVGQEYSYSPLTCKIVGNR